MLYRQNGGLTHVLLATTYFVFSHEEGCSCSWNTVRHLKLCRQAAGPRSSGIDLRWRKEKVPLGGTFNPSLLSAGA